MTLAAGDKAHLSTIPGSLKISMEHGGTVTNLINKLIDGSTFFNLELGENILYFTCTGDVDDVDINITPMMLYAGV